MDNPKIRILFNALISSGKFSGVHYAVVELLEAFGAIAEKELELEILNFDL
jgi:hypothetical protein